MCELLLEVVGEQAPALFEDGEGRVVAHGAGRLSPVRDHGRDHVLQLFARVAEGHLLLLEVLLRLGGLDLALLDVLVEIDEVLPYPVAVRLGGDDLVSNVIAGEQASSRRIDGDHLAWAQPSLQNDRVLFQRHHPHLGPHDDDAVGGDLIAGGAQAVAVEGGAHKHAVAEDDAGRAVPGLADAGVVLVEIAAGPGHVRHVLPGLRNQHHQRV